jgi:SAM-dependent methyltransferase
MSNPTHASFAEDYVKGNPPWDIDKPQPPFRAIADEVESPVLDSGCGTGGMALHFAARGHVVTGIDFVEQAIDLARAKGTERGVAVEFLVMDAMTLASWDRSFATVLDSGLFHIYGGDERKCYVAGLAHVLRPGGRLYLFSFADGAPVPGGGLSRQQIHDAFADGWEIESLDYANGEMNPAFEAPQQFADAKMWFAVIRRRG